MRGPKPCPDCSNAPVYHSIVKNSFYIDLFFLPFIASTRGIWRWVEPHLRPTMENKFLPATFRLSAKVRLGEIVTEPDQKTTKRGKVFWKEAERRGINMWEFRPFGKSLEFFVAEHNGNIVGFESLPRPGKREPKSLDWVDDKRMIRKKLGESGIPIAKGGSAWSLRKAKDIFLKINGTAIVKPHRGSLTRHTTTHIRTLSDLEVAFKKAKMLSPMVLIEEELQGMVHRVTLIDGKVAGILRREPSNVIGDGIHNIRELVEIENKNPIRLGEIFHALVIDAAAEEELGRTGHTSESIPKKDSMVFLHQKASRNIGGGATDMTEFAHPDNIAVFEKVARILDDPIVGIDFIISDIKKSWKEVEGVGVIECNSMPGIDLHHYPLVGKPRNVAGAIWDIVMPSSKNPAGYPGNS